MGALPTWHGDDDLTAGTGCYCGARNTEREHIQANNNVYARPYPRSTVRTHAGGRSKRQKTSAFHVSHCYGIGFFGWAVTVTST
jgi:hypothetical protein